MHDVQPFPSRLASGVQYRDHVRGCPRCAVDGDRPSGSFLGIGAYYERQHVGGGLPTTRHAARASREPSWSEGCSVCRAPGVGAECTSRLAAFARTTPMADDRHTSMAFVTPCVPSKCDLLPHPPSIPTPLPSMPNWPPTCPARPPESIHPDGSIFVDHCQCKTTCKSHCITTHHNTPCFLNAARTCLVYVCLLSLFCPCAFFGCDLMACMGHLIFSFLCKHTSAALRHVCLCARM